MRNLDSDFIDNRKIGHLICEIDVCTNEGTITRFVCGWYRKGSFQYTIEVKCNDRPLCCGHI